MRALGLPLLANAAMFMAFGRAGTPEFLSLAVLLAVGFLVFEAPREAAQPRFSRSSALVGVLAMGLYALVLAKEPRPIPVLVASTPSRAVARALFYTSGQISLADALSPMVSMIRAAWARPRSRALACLIALTFLGYRFAFGADTYWEVMCTPTCNLLRSANHFLRPELTAAVVAGQRGPACELGYGDFRVDVQSACGGCFAVAVMLFAIAFVSIEQPARFRGMRWLPFGLGGIVVMLLANLLRIELILFLGLWSARAFGYPVAADLVEGLFHSNAGLLVYTLVTGVYFYLALPSALATGAPRAS